MALNRYIAAVALAGCVLTLTGCGTVFGRAGNHSKAYPGLRQDIAFLGFYGGNANTAEGASAHFCYLSVICPPFAVLSIPIDVAVDTVLLPLDLFTRGRSVPRSQTSAAQPLDVDRQTIPVPRHL